MEYSPNSTWLDTARLDTTRHVRRVEPSRRACRPLLFDKLDTILLLLAMLFTCVSCVSKQHDMVLQRELGGKQANRCDTSAALVRSICRAYHPETRARHVERVVSCRDVTSQVELGLTTTNDSVSSEAVTKQRLAAACKWRRVTKCSMRTDLDRL